MRTLIVCGMLAMAVVGTASAGALAVDMPAAATANVAAMPNVSVDAFGTTADDFTGYGLRGQVKVNDSYAVYGSVGVPEDGLGVGIGGIMTLPFDLPFATGVRGGVGYWSDEVGGLDMSSTDINAALVASGGLDDVVEGLGWFLSLGVHYVMYEYEYMGVATAKTSKDIALPDLPIDGGDLSDLWDLPVIPDGGDWETVFPDSPTLTKMKDDDSDTLVHVGIGLIYDISDAVGVFAGADFISGDYVDETFIGGGVRVGLGGGSAEM